MSRNYCKPGTIVPLTGLGLGRDLSGIAPVDYSFEEQWTGKRWPAFLPIISVQQIISLSFQSFNRAQALCLGVIYVVGEKQGNHSRHQAHAGHHGVFPVQKAGAAY